MVFKIFSRYLPSLQHDWSIICNQSFSPLNFGLVLTIICWIIRQRSILKQSQIKNHVLFLYFNLVKHVSLLDTSQGPNLLPRSSFLVLAIPVLVRSLSPYQLDIFTITHQQLSYCATVVKLLQNSGQLSHITNLVSLISNN